MKTLLGALLAFATTVASGALLCAVTACAQPVTREQIGGALARDVLAPLHADAARDLAHLLEAIRAHCSGPRPATGTASLQAAYRQARRAWSRAAVVEIGPAKRRRSLSRIDWRPVDPERVASELDGEEPLTFERARDRFPASQRGLPAVSSLLGTLEEAYGPRAELRRCQYLDAIGAVAADEARQLSAEWTAWTSPQASRDEPAPFDAAMLVDDVVRGSVLALEDLVDRELRERQAGDRVATPDPLDVLGRVEGIAAIYLGRTPDELGRAAQGGTEAADTVGVAALVAARSPATDHRVRSALGRSLAAATRFVEGPSDQELVEALAELQLTWSTEVVSLLGVVVGFSDNDGDTG